MRISLARLSDTLTSQAKTWLSQLNHSRIPRNAFEIGFARASGPGGQNVNKVSTKATIKLAPAILVKSEWLPKPVLSQILEKPGFPYLTKAKGIVVQSDLTRSRESNLEDCFVKLARAIQSHVWFATEMDPERVKKWDRM